MTMPNKPTDSEIIKALECCNHIETDCELCPLYTTKECSKVMLDSTLDLINRLQAENERLNDKVKGFEKIRRAYQRMIHESMPNIQTALDKVLKELVGEDNA